MTWKITVKPTSDALDAWTWTAEAADGEGVLFGEVPYSSHETALNIARERVSVEELRRTTIADATTVEEYTPTEAEILAAK